MLQIVSKVPGWGLKSFSMMRLNEALDIKYEVATIKTKGSKVIPLPLYSVSLLEVFIDTYRPPAAWQNAQTPHFHFPHQKR